MRRAHGRAAACSCARRRTRRDRVVCVVGVAGAGKTTALRVLADAYRESGVPVLGAAPSGRAADELTAATGIRSRTIHRLLLDAQHEGGLPRGCVLIVDEAGMAETRMLAPLLELVEQAEGKVILVGDPAQLPAVGAGGLFPTLCDRLGAIEPDREPPPTRPDRARALAHLRAGDPEPYLAHAARPGASTSTTTPTSAKQRLLEDWWQAAQHDLAGTVMLAYRRDDVRDLNDAARALMLRAGRLGPERSCSAAASSESATASSAATTTRGSASATAPARPSSTSTRRGADAPDGRGATPHASTLDYAAEHLEHGYALTGHAAQGATVDRAFVLLRDQGALREWGYVACTRARTKLASTQPVSRSKASSTGASSPRAIQPHAWQTRWNGQAPRNSHPSRHCQKRAKSRDAPGNAAGASASKRSRRPSSASPPPRSNSAASAGSATVASAPNYEPRSPISERPSDSPAGSSPSRRSSNPSCGRNAPRGRASNRNRACPPERATAGATSISNCDRLAAGSGSHGENRNPHAPWAR